MNIYVIYKFADYEVVNKTLNEIKRVISRDSRVFLFEPKARKDKAWRNYAKKKLKESNLVIVFDSLSKSDNDFGKNVLWEIKKAEKLKKRIIVFKTDPDSENRSWYEYDYSEKAPRYPRYETVSLKEAVGFMKKEYGWEIKDNLLNKNDVDVSVDKNEKQLLLEQYRIMIDTSEKLMERRQETVGLYTTLCTAIMAIIGTSFAFDNLIVTEIVLFLSGLILFIICRNWYLSLNSFDLNITGKFEVINCLEKQLPAEIFECEYRYNKLNGIQSFSSREKILPKIFSVMGITLMIISMVLLLVSVLEKLGFIAIIKNYFL